MLVLVILAILILDAFSLTLLATITVLVLPILAFLLLVANTTQSIVMIESIYLFICMLTH